MSYRTVEVELDHGHVLAKGAESLPEKASGLLTIFQSDAVNPAAISPLAGFGITAKTSPPGCGQGGGMDDVRARSQTLMPG